MRSVLFVVLEERRFSDLSKVEYLVPRVIFSFVLMSDY